MSKNGYFSNMHITKTYRTEKLLQIKMYLLQDYNKYISTIM